MSNHRKNVDSVPVSMLAKWIVIAAFVGLTGLSYVYLKNQQHITGAQITRLEGELKSIQSQNQDVRAGISVLKSRAVLERHLQAGFIKMVPITEDRIVRLNLPSTVEGSEVRTVANSRVMK